MSSKPVHMSPVPISTIMILLNIEEIDLFFSISDWWRIRIPSSVDFSCPFFIGKRYCIPQFCFQYSYYSSLWFYLIFLRNIKHIHSQHTIHEHFYSIWCWCCHSHCWQKLNVKNLDVVRANNCIRVTFNYKYLFRIFSSLDFRTTWPQTNEIPNHSVIAMNSAFGESFMFLTKLAWSSKVTLPILVTAVFLALDFRMQIELNIETEQIVFQVSWLPVDAMVNIELQ